MTEIEKEAKRLEKLMSVSKAWNRLRLLRFPCFEPYEGDHETKLQRNKGGDNGSKI